MCLMVIIFKIISLNAFLPSLVAYELHILTVHVMYTHWSSLVNRFPLKNSLLGSIADCNIYWVAANHISSHRMATVLVGGSRCK